MHPELLAVLRDRRLGRAERELLLYVFAHTNGTLEAAIEVDQLMTDLELTGGTLRRLRTGLEGWMRSRQRGSILECEIERHVVKRHEFSENEKPCRENSHFSRNPDGENFSENEKNARKVRSSDGQNFSENENSAPRAEREKVARAHIGIVKQLKQQLEVKAAGSFDARTDELLKTLGVDPGIREQLAGMRFEAAAKHVADWQRAKRNGKKLGVGALVNQMREWPVPVDVTRADLQAGILEDLVTDDDLEAWGLPDPLAGYSVPEGYEDIMKH